MLVLVWLATAGANTLASLATPWAAAVPAVLAAVTAPTAFSGSPLLRYGGAAFLLTAPLVTIAPEAAWPVAGLAALLSMTVRGTPAATTLDDLQRHLALCRRRDEQADVLVMHVPAAAARDSASLRSALRFTDSVHVDPEAGGYVVTAVLGDVEVSRTGLEQRVRERLETADVRFGWARFPTDGLTLDVLTQLADPGASAGSDPGAAMAATATPAGAAR